MIPMKHILAAALAVAITVAANAATATAAEAIIPPGQSWSFSGPRGMFDRAQLQRGFKVYREVCQNCHGLNLVSFRNLAEPGGPEFSRAQAAAIAKEYKIKDGPNDAGEMFEREGRLADRFPQPWANENAARQQHNGAVPPDLSLMAKARTYERGFPWFLFDIFTQYQEQGVDYMVALLTGYKDPPQGFQLPPGSNYNTYFPGHAIAMPPPLQNDQVPYTDGTPTTVEQYSKDPPQGFQLPPGSSYNTYFPGHAIAMPPPLSNDQIPYTDGTPTTVEQYSKDVAAFLMWTAEPHMEARKRIGFQVMIFLIVFAGLLYFTKKKVWAEVKGHA